MKHTCTAYIKLRLQQRFKKVLWQYAFNTLNINYMQWEHQYHPACPGSLVCNWSAAKAEEAAAQRNAECNAKNVHQNQHDKGSVHGLACTTGRVRGSTIARKLAGINPLVPVREDIIASNNDPDKEEKADEWLTATGTRSSMLTISAILLFAAQAHGYEMSAGLKEADSSKHNQEYRNHFLNVTVVQIDGP